MKKFFAILLAMSLLFSLMTTAALAEGPKRDGTSKAKVTFKDGMLEFGDLLGSSNMDFNFGERELPLDTVTYKDVEGDHYLTVLDANTKLDTWTVTGELYAFKNGTTSEFDGTITLKSGTISATSAGTVVVAGDSIALVPGTPVGTHNAVPVMNGEETRADTFVATWKADNIELGLTKAAANAVVAAGPASYVANIEWLLTVG